MGKALHFIGGSSYLYGEIAPLKKGEENEKNNISSDVSFLAGPNNTCAWVHSLKFILKPKSNKHCARLAYDSIYCC